jgi:uncharacterized protein YuzE
MRVSYDEEADALNITLLEGNFECRVVRLTEDIALDFAPGEKLVSIEILNAKKLGIIGSDSAIHLNKVKAVMEMV